MYNSLTQSLLLCVVVSLGLLAPISDHNIRTETNEKNVKRKHKYVIRKFISLRNFLPLLFHAKMITLLLYESYFCSPLSSPSVRGGDQVPALYVMRFLSFFLY